MDPAIKTDQNRAEFIATIMEWRRVTEKTANLYWTDGWRVVERGIPSAPRAQRRRPYRPPLKHLRGG